MANIAGLYDENAEVSTSFELLPIGDYPAQIIEADIEEISSRNDYGKCLKMTWQITDGEYENRLVWQRLSLWPNQSMNNSDRVAEIANSQFAAIRGATGKLNPVDTDELLFIPCLLSVKIRHDKTGQYEPSNEVKTVKPLAGQPTAAPAQAPQQQQAQEQAQSAPAARQAPAQTQQRAAPAQTTQAQNAKGTRPWRQQTPPDDDVPF